MINIRGSGATCVEYNNCNNITIRFDDSEMTMHTRWDHFIQGTFSSPFDKTHYGGYIGFYNKNRDLDKQKAYNTWLCILKRCFDEKFKEENPTYKNASMCDEWMNYSNFYNWIINQKNYDKWNNNFGWCVDKDILIKGNKVYSPDTCCLVPHKVNVLFCKNDKHRGHLPIGVTYFKKSDKYKVTLTDSVNYKGKTTKYLGVYKTPEEAFNVYKSYKEKMIRRVAESEYKNQNITEQCYKAMINYKVEITD